MRAEPGSHRLVLISQNYCHLEEQTNGSEPAHQVTISRSAREAVGITTWQLFGKQALYNMSWWTLATPKRYSYFREMSSDSLNQHKKTYTNLTQYRIHLASCVLPKNAVSLPNNWSLKHSDSLLLIIDQQAQGKVIKNVKTGHYPRKRTSLGAQTHCWRSQKELMPQFRPVASESQVFLQSGIGQPRVDPADGDKTSKKGFHWIFLQSVFTLLGTGYAEVRTFSCRPFISLLQPCEGHCNFSPIPQWMRRTEKSCGMAW